MARKTNDATVRDKLKDLDPHFLEDVDRMSGEALKQSIVNLTRHRETIEQARKDDEDLQAAKGKVKDINETYATPLKANRLKVKYLLSKLDTMRPTDESSRA